MCSGWYPWHDWVAPSPGYTLLQSHVLEASHSASRQRGSLCPLERESEWPYVIYIMSRAVSRRRVCCCYRPGCDAISITALGLRRARLGIIPLYKSTLVCTTVTYDCSLLHAFAVTTTTLEPAEAEISSTAETMVINSCRPVTAKLVKEKHKA